jgi:hypothetical protein
MKSPSSRGGYVSTGARTSKIVTRTSCIMAWWCRERGARVPFDGTIAYGMRRMRFCHEDQRVRHAANAFLPRGATRSARGELVFATRSRFAWPCLSATGRPTTTQRISQWVLNRICPQFAPHPPNPLSNSAPTALRGEGGAGQTSRLFSPSPRSIAEQCEVGEGGRG